MPAVPEDTDAAVFDILVGRWRAMTVTEKMALVDQICIDVERLAIAGIVAGSPDASEVEIRYQLAQRRFGHELADAAYGDRLAAG